MKKLNFESLPLAVQELKVKIDNITVLLKSSKPDEQQNKLLTIEEAAKFLNIFQEELKAYIKSGKVKTVADLENEADDFLSNHKKGLNYV